MVTPGVVPLRPLALGELLDGAVKVIRRYPRPSLGLSALIAVVTTVVGVLTVLAQDYSSFADTIRSSDSSDRPFVSTDISSVPGGLVGALASVVLTGFLVAVVGKAVLGQPLTFGETWQQVRPRVLPLVGLALLTGLLAFGPLVLSVIVAVVLAVISPVLLVVGIPLVIASAGLCVYIYVRLSLAPAALVLEKSSVRTAINRSGVLVKGDWWRLFGIMLLIQLITQVVTFVLSLPFVVIGGANLLAHPNGGGFTALFLVTQVGAGLATFLVGPFAAAARALLYVDRRMRAEGLDLTLQAAARG